MTKPKPSNSSGDETPMADVADANTEPGYAEALAELETILSELDSSQVDVDRLGDQVGRAATLIRICRARIETARSDVEHIVADLEPNRRDTE